MIILSHFNYFCLSYKHKKKNLSFPRLLISNLASFRIVYHIVMVTNLIEKHKHNFKNMLPLIEKKIHLGIGDCHTRIVAIGIS